MYSGSRGRFINTPIRQKRLRLRRQHGNVALFEVDPVQPIGNHTLCCMADRLRQALERTTRSVPPPTSSFDPAVPVSAIGAEAFNASNLALIVVK